MIPPKTLEVKIRPYPSQIQEKPDQKGLARVYLSSDALLDLGLKPGQVCVLWRASDGDEVEGKREAVAWNTLDKSMGKKVVQMSRAMQEACGFRLAEDLRIMGRGELEVVREVRVRDVSAKGFNEIGELVGEEKKHWEWYLGDFLSRAEVAFPGMHMKNVSIWGVKRSFVVDSVNGRSTDIGKFHATSSVSIGSSVLDTESNGTNTTIPLLEVDIAGIGQALQQLNQFLHNFSQQILFSRAQRECAVLLHGSRGTGKTYVMNKVIETGWAKKVVRINDDTLPSSLPGIFRDARLNQPTIVAIDDFETLFINEDKTARNFKRILGEELDHLTHEQSQSSLPRVLVIAATTDSAQIPLELKIDGRFETEISLPVPDAFARKAILRSLKPAFYPFQYDETLNALGDRTHAYTPRDLVKLLKKTYRFAEERMLTNDPIPAQDECFLSQEDIDKGLQLVRPTAMHDITLQPPPVRWTEIGGQAKVKKALRHAVEVPLLHPQIIKRLGARAQKGLLLYGPPGCSKTLTAQAMATESSFNFFAVKGAELLNMYVGESERAIRNIFSRAEAAKPSVIFFDEIDSIASGRERQGNGGGVQVLATMLNCMDGIEALNGVFVLAATNRPDILDKALLRPGRFDQSIYVRLPDLSDRMEILEVQKKKMDFADDVDIKELARLTEGYSGAELVAVCQRGCEGVIERCIESGKEEKIGMDDLRRGLRLVKKQVTTESLRVFEKFAREGEPVPAVQTGLFSTGAGDGGFGGSLL